MKNGSGVKAVLFIDGQLVNFSLALVIDKMYNWSRPNHKFIFVSDDKKMYSNNFYSGGETGFGQDRIWELKAEEYEIVSMDLDYIINFQKEEEEREEKEREEYKIKQDERVKKLNQLPKQETIYNYLGLTAYIQRSEASFDSRMSSKIQHSYSLKIVGQENRWFDLSDYYNKAGGVLLKKFEGDMQYQLGIEPKGKEFNRKLLEDLTSAYKSYKSKINIILNG